MKRNSRGFTLIELLAVIAIMGVLAGLVVFSVSSVSTTKLGKFANECESLLSRCRVDSLSGAVKPRLEFSVSGDKTVCTLYENSVSVADAKLDLTLGSCSVTLNSGSVTTISSGTTFSLSFDPVSGVQLKPKIGDAESDYYCTKISISGNATYIIELTPETGYHTLKR